MKKANELSTYFDHSVGQGPGEIFLTIFPE